MTAFITRIQCMASSCPSPVHMTRDKCEECTEVSRAALYIGTVSKPTDPRSKMNFTCRSRRDDWLFVIALLVPAVFASARYFESERQIAQIAQAEPRSALVTVDSHAREHLRVAYAQSQSH
jgi:hypothetical protein